MAKKQNRFEKHACDIKNEAECEEELDAEDADFKEEESDFYEEEDEY
ncbi:MAG TPA: hypothetical protein PK357_02735 [Candidatus Pacearchaeota archaeon]|nr:hypothetical protein [Candidatus Pacearchaeota archaeon]